MSTQWVAKPDYRALWLTCCVALMGAAPAIADRGQIVVRATADVQVTNEAQNAIVAWDGQREVLVLSTALSASGNATVLEFLPLPAAPTSIKRASEGIFDAVERLIADHAPVRRTPPPRTRGMGVGPKTEAPALVQIVRHERIGAHDITVAKATDAQALVKWAGRYVSGLGIQMDSLAEGRLRSAASDYIERGLRCFVFDVVKLTRRAKSVEPIAYQFPSKSLYFPLRVTRLAAGETSINLFLIATGKPDPGAGGTRLSVSVYQWEDNSGGSARKTEPIAFALHHDDLIAVDTAIARMFPRQAWFTAAHYKGSTTALRRDLMLSRLEKDPPPSAGHAGHMRALERQPRLLDAHLSRNGRTLCVEAEEAFDEDSVGLGPRIFLVPCSGGPMLALPFHGYASPQCWSPDSRRICAARSTPTARNICVVEAKTGRTTQLTHFSAPPPAFSDMGVPAWEPKGNRIAFTAYNNLWMVNADGSNLRRLTDHPQIAYEHPTYRTPYPLWSPDGTAIAYWRCINPRGNMDWEPRVYDVKAGRSISLARGLPTIHWTTVLSWQPSGQWLAFNFFNTPEGQGGIWTARRDGRGAKRVVSGRIQRPITPLWAPDGNWLIVCAREQLPPSPAQQRSLSARFDAMKGRPVQFQPCHFLNDERLNPLGFSPDGKDLLALRRGKIVLAHLDGSGWREITLVPPSSARLRPGTEPWLAWRSDPAAKDVVQKARQVLSVPAHQRQTKHLRITGVDCMELYKSLTAAQRARLKTAGALRLLPCSMLSPKQMNMLKRALIADCMKRYWLDLGGMKPQEVDLSRMPPPGLPFLPDLVDLRHRKVSFQAWKGLDGRVAGVECRVEFEREDMGF